MPTAGRMIAGLSFAVAAFLVAGYLIDELPVQRDLGLMRPAGAVIGFITAWKVMGWRFGKGYRAALGSGFVGLIAVVFWCLVVLGIYEMFASALEFKFDDPVEAVLSIGQVLFDFTVVIATRPETAAISVTAAFIAGIVGEFAERRWR